MNQKSQQRAIANKIKKWLKAAADLSNKETIFALPITRLTSIKSLCTDETAAQQFALYISQRVQQSMNRAESPSELTPEEWSTHKNLMADAIALQLMSNRRSPHWMKPNSTTMRQQYEHSLKLSDYQTRNAEAAGANYLATNEPRQG